MVKRLFRQNLQLPEEKQTPSYEPYLKLFRKRYDEIKRTSRSTKVNSEQNEANEPFNTSPSLDEYLNTNLFGGESKSLTLNFFCLSDRIEISGK